jgi:ketosteroid isomerase-like protein
MSPTGRGRPAVVIASALAMTVSLVARVTITFGLIDSRHGIVNLACGTHRVPSPEEVTVTLSTDRIEQLVESYLAAWNATDATERRALIASAWTEDARYTDPLAQSTGRDGIDAMIAGIQAQFAGTRFARVGPIDAHNGFVRFSWSLSSQSGSAVAKGTDFATLDDGRFRSVTGFLDALPEGT